MTGVPFTIAFPLQLKTRVRTSHPLAACHCKCARSLTILSSEKLWKFSVVECSEGKKTAEAAAKAERMRQMQERLAAWQAENAPQ